ncbi:MAG: hypothetical protein IKJ89_01440, partial [Kiritimatiellae bacterium]|nr:hypothetical protein [Kiritimatiellia bacterium]
MTKEKRTCLLVCAVCAFLAGAAEAGKPLPYRHFDLGVGSYGSGYAWGNGTPLDVARHDWAMVTFTNESVDRRTTDRLNAELEINPKMKIVVRLWPKPGYLRATDAPKAKRRYIGFLDYLYYPEAKKAFLDEALRHLHLVLDNVTKPENVYGATLFEEMPHQFGGDVSILEKVAPGTPVNEYLAQFGDFYERETGRKMTEWNRDVRVWWGRKYAEALSDVYRSIKKDSPNVRLFVWFMSHYRLLDWLEPGEDVHTPKVIPCHWRDLIRPGELADGFFAYANNAFWAKRCQKLASDNHWPYFSQLSHSGGMRIGSWEECLAIAKADLPENLGYFFYAPDFSYGHWNDDPAVAPEDVPDLASMYDRMRVVLARENVGMDVVRRHLVPEVVLSHDLGKALPDNFELATATIVNRRTTKWFPTAEEATLRNVTATLGVPPGFTIPASVSAGATVTIPVLKPGETKTVMWWVRRERAREVGEKLPVSLTVAADGVRPVTVGSEEPVSNPVPHASFDAKRSGDSFVYVNWGLPWAKRMPEVTLECLRAGNSMLQNPRIRVGTRQIAYDGVMKPGEKLVVRGALVAELVTRGGRADVSDRIVGEELRIGKGVTEIAYFDDYPTWGSAKARITIRFPDLMAYDPELRDRCWMWGHDSGVYDGTNNVYNIPVSAPISMCDAIRYMGIPNVCAVRWFPATKDRAYLEDFRKAKRFSWVACGDNRWATKYELSQGCLDAMKTFPNMTGMDYDDFFQGGTNVLQECSSGRVAAESACFTLKEMEGYRAKLAALGRPTRPETRLVLYSGQIKPSIRHALERVDTILFWTWNGKDLAGLEKNIAKLREIAPTQKILLGIYMWDFGGRKPIEMKYMRHQLDVARKLFHNGTIEG